jgi:hypothetical protein
VLVSCLSIGNFVEMERAGMLRAYESKLKFTNYGANLSGGPTAAWVEQTVAV